MSARQTRPGKAALHRDLNALLGERLRAVRVFGYALATDDAEEWHGLSVVLTARLSPRQRRALAWAALRALPPDEVSAIANAVLPDGAGPPVPPLFDVVDHAASWADLADPDELAAYAVAIFRAMPAPKRRAFLDFAERQAA